ncbi:MAG: DUF3035 domain-containing protein [Pseudomonadota bacterium]
MRARNVILIAAAVGVSGCGDLAEELGLGKQSPDEFQVVRRAPLSVPPNMALRPPRPGEVAENRLTSESQVREVLFSSGSGAEGAPVMTLNFDDAGGASVSGAGFGGGNGLNAGGDFGPSDAERELLRQAGADRVSSAIRSVVDAESSERVYADDYLLDRILFWRETRREQVVDAGAEADRLRADAAAGRRTTGEGAATRTSSSAGGGAGLLDGIF